MIASLSVTVTGLLGAAGGGEARVGGGFHHNQQQQQQQLQQLQEQQQQLQQKQHQTQSLEEATEQEPAFKISPPGSPEVSSNTNNSNLPLSGANFPVDQQHQQQTEAQLHLPFNPENGQLSHPLVSHTQGKILSVHNMMQINPPSSKLVGGPVEIP